MRSSSQRSFKRSSPKISFKLQGSLTLSLKEEAIETLEAEAAAGGSSAKALDPCLETGEVGEGPVVESPVEAVPDKAVEKRLE